MPSFDFARMRPRVIKKDKNELYDDALKLKVVNNNILNENLKLKTRMKKYELEM